MFQCTFNSSSCLFHLYVYSSKHIPSMVLCLIFLKQVSFPSQWVKPVKLWPLVHNFVKPLKLWPSVLDFVKLVKFWPSVQNFVKPVKFWPSVHNFVKPMKLWPSCSQFCKTSKIMAFCSQLRTAVRFLLCVTYTQELIFPPSFLF